LAIASQASALHAARVAHLHGAPCADPHEALPSAPVAVGGARLGRPHVGDGPHGSVVVPPFRQRLARDFVGDTALGGIGIVAVVVAPVADDRVPVRQAVFTDRAAASRGAGP
jgi:hypothetical protein